MGEMGGPCAGQAVALESELIIPNPTANETGILFVSGFFITRSYVGQKNRSQGN